MLDRALLLSIVILAGCPNGGTSSDGGGSPIDGGPDGGSVECQLDLEVGTITPDLEVGRDVQSAMPGSFVTYARGPVADGSSDLLVITLWDGYGAFAGGPVTAGTYEIVGVDTNYIDCGLCVYVLADFDDQGTPDPGDDTFAQIYMAE